MNKIRNRLLLLRVFLQKEQLEDDARKIYTEEDIRAVWESRYISQQGKECR